MATRHTIFSGQANFFDPTRSPGWTAECKRRLRALRNAGKAKRQERKLLRYWLGRHDRWRGVGSGEPGYDRDNWQELTERLLSVLLRPIVFRTVRQAPRAPEQRWIDVVREAQAAATHGLEMAITPDPGVGFPGDPVDRSAD